MDISDALYLYKKFKRNVDGEECIMPMELGVIVNDKFFKYEAFSRFEFTIKWSKGSTSLFYYANLKDLVEYNDGIVNIWDSA